MSLLLDTRGGGGLEGHFFGMCVQAYLPKSYTWSSKKMTYSYTWLNKMLTNSHTFLWYLYTFFAVCKQSLQINIAILVFELNIWAKIWVFQAGMSENGTIKKQI